MKKNMYTQFFSHPISGYFFLSLLYSQYILSKNNASPDEILKGNFLGRTL